MRKLMIVVVTALAGCAGMQPAPAQPKASQMEVQARTKDYMNCLVPIAKRYDDGISDARTVAASTVGGCPEKYEDLFEALTRSDNDAVKRIFRHRQSQMQTDLALNVVLQLRAAARQ